MKFKKTISALLSLAMSAGLTANVLSTSYLNVNAETTTAKTDFLLGDVNGNGMVDAVDASSVLTYYAKTSTGKDGGFTEIQMKAADMNENGLVDATDASAILTFYAKSSVDNGGSSGTVELSNFKASVWDIYINTEETVKFTVDVTADEKLAEKAVALYDDSDNLVAYMNDDGKNGDEKANDGVYSVDVELSSAETEIVNYYASNGKEKSNTRKISFYRNLTQDDLDGFNALLDDIENLSFQQVCDYLKSSDKIKQITIDDDEQYISFQSVYGMNGLWETPDAEEKLNCAGRDRNSIPESDLQNKPLLENLKKAIEKIEKNNNYIVNNKVSCRVAVRDLIDTSDNEFSKLIGEAINKALEAGYLNMDEDEITGDSEDEFDEKIGSVDVKYDSDVTVDSMRKLDGYDTVILRTHGGNKGNVYITTGEILPKGVEEFKTLEFWSADSFRGSIGYLTEGRNFVIYPEFFDANYEDGSLDNSIWYFGSCHTLETNEFSDILLKKGADTVLGYDGAVYINYLDKMLFETFVNGMILSADTVGDSVKEAKRIFGNDDSDGTKLIIKGNRDYRYIAEADTANIVTSLPITTTTTVPVATATTITTTKAASEMPPDIFGEKVYSMPGNIAISFSPIDAGTNRDPRTLDIITKLYNELDDSDKATYHSYTGAVTFSFSPKYTTDKGVEVGEYSSLGDILNCARSIDDTFSFFMSNLEEGEDSSRTAWVECYNNDFDAASGELIHRNYSTREEKIYEYAKKDNETFNMYSAIFGNRSFLCEGRNDTIITIVKDDYYYYKWNSFAGILTKYSARMWYNNYFVNHEHDYGGTMVHYVIDLRPKYDAALKDMCGESGGKYIQYSEENLDNLIKLINARRAYIDEYSRIQSEKWK